MSINTNENNKKRIYGAKRRMLSLVLFLIALISGFLCLLIQPESQEISAFDIPEDYAQDYDSTFKLLGPGNKTGNEAPGIAYENDDTFVIYQNVGFITLARVSQTCNFRGKTIKITDTTILFDLSVKRVNGKIDSNESFCGIGNEAMPFCGTLDMGTAGTKAYTYLGITDWNALFNNISNEASVIGTENRKLRSSQSAPFAFANKLTITTSNDFIMSGFLFAGTETQEDNTTTGVVLAAPTAGFVAAKVSASTEAAQAECLVDLSSSFTKGVPYTLTSTGGDAGGLFGEIDSGVNLKVKTSNFNGEITSRNGNAGLLVGKNNGTFELINGLSAEENDTNTVFSGSVSAGDNGSAGLIGTNNGTAIFNDVTIETGLFKGKYTGGIVGYSAAASAVQLNGNVTVSGMTSEAIYNGGFIGHNAGTYSSAEGKNYKVIGAKLKGKNSLSYTGGFFGLAEGAADLKGTYTAGGAGTDINSFSGGGVLGGFVGKSSVLSEAPEMDACQAEFNPSSSSSAIGGFAGQITTSISFLSDVQFVFTFNSLRSGNVGGLIGEIVATASNVVISKKSPEVQSLSISNTFGTDYFSGSSRSLGGIVGKAGDGVYLNINAVSVTNSTTKRLIKEMADLVGLAGDNSFINLGNIEYKNKTIGSVAVGSTNVQTILRLYGSIKDASNRFSHIVTSQDRSVLFADSGFTFDYGKAIIEGNDVGNFGQILRNDTLQFLEYDEDSHTVTAKSPLDVNNLSLSTAADVAKIYVTLSTKGLFSCLKNGAAGIMQGISSCQALLNATFKFGNDISLDNSGVEQFTRATWETLDGTSRFQGKIEGNNHTLTLAIGQNLNGENVGIKSLDNERRFIGAFSAASNATVEGLTIRTVGDNVKYYGNQISQEVFIGGLFGYSLGAITVNSCKTYMSLELNSGNNDRNSSLYVGGFVGEIRNGTNETNVILSVTNSEIAPAISHVGSVDKTTAYIGGAAGIVENVNADITFTNNEVKTHIVQEVEVKNAYIGGVFAELSCSDYINLNLSGTKAEGASIVSNASETAGGLLGREYTKCCVTVNSEWIGTVENNGSADVSGGLLYSLSGKMIVENGFSFGAANGTSKFSSKGTTKGTLLGIGTHAFVVIRSSQPSGFEHVNAEGYDLFVGRNISETDTYSGLGTKGGLLTIETGSGDIGKIPGSSAWFALIAARENNKTRYYFNIEGLETAQLSVFNNNVVSSPADLIFFNVYEFISDNEKALPDYLKTNNNFRKPVTAIEGAANNIDMTDYSFYPTKKGGVTFAFSKNELKFGIQDAKVSPEITNQFYGLQSGIFSDIAISGNGSTSVVFRDVTLSGTIFPVSNGSGAFVCGKIYGTRTSTLTAVAMVEVSDVSFKGLTVDASGNANYRPLFINALDSNTSCVFRGIKQAENSYDVSNAKAATSLIGKGGLNVSGTLSSSIYVDFSEIVFDNSNGGESAIFSTAMLFEEINCIGGSGSFVYNFNYSEDWVGSTHKKQVTYGEELYTNEKQRKYFDNNTHYVSPDPNATDSPYDFRGWLVYVKVNPNNLMVNRKGVTFDDGFGTYEHPYVISGAEQLVFLGNIFGGSIKSFDENWSIRFPKKEGNSYIYSDSDEYVVPKNGNGKPIHGSTILDLNTLISYLQGAYYKIVGEEELSLTSDFIGIGTASYPFHGVIVGNNKTIIIQDSRDIGTTGFGGLINVANGCAVYGVTLKYREKISLSKVGNSLATTTTDYTNTSAAPVTGTAHFGGVIGWIIGGDNLIDTVTVQIDELENGHYSSAFGGYVGLISGGGVSLRNLGELKVPSLSADYYYYNPYVGKIISGYAISNDNTYDNTYGNTDDNTEGHCIIPGVTLASITQGCEFGKYNQTDIYEFKIKDAKQLLMLSYAMNSGALSYSANKLAYGSSFGALSRFGSYGQVGSQNPAGVFGGRYTEDTTGGDGGSNLFTQYFHCAKKNWNSTEFIITLSSGIYDLSAYKNAFRGLGSSIVYDNCFRIKKVSGVASANGKPGTTIKFGSEIKEYYASKSREKDAVSHLALVINRPVMDNNRSIEFSDISLTGYLNIVVTDSSGKPCETKLNEDFYVGGFVSYATNASFKNVAIDGAEIKSPGYAGALAAKVEYTKGIGSDNRAVNGCTVSNKSVINGICSTGGLFGDVKMHNTATTIIETVSVDDTTIRARGDFAATNSNHHVGGLIGMLSDGSNNNQTLKIAGAKVVKSAIIFESKSKTGMYAGGMIGAQLGSTKVEFTTCSVNGCVVAAVTSLDVTKPTYPTEYSGKYEISNNTTVVYDAILYAIKHSIVESGNKPNDYGSSAGGFVGCTNKGFNATDCEVLSAAAATIILSNKNSGGLLGFATDSATFTLKNIQVCSTGNNPIYIIGKLCAAGVCASFTEGKTVTVTADDLFVTGTTNNEVRIIATATGNSTTTNVGGLFATDAGGSGTDKFTIIINNAEVSHCVIVGNRVAGVYCCRDPFTRGYFSNIRIYNNYMQMRGNCIGGVLICTATTTTIDGLYLGDNIIHRTFKGSQVAGIVMNVDSGTTLNCYDVLFIDNDLGCRTTEDTFYVEKFLSCNGGQSVYTDGITTVDVAALVYKISGKFNAFSISRQDKVIDNRVLKSDYCSGSSTSFSAVYVAFGAAQKYRDSLQNGTLMTQKEAIDSMSFSATLASGSNLTLNGDPVTKVEDSVTGEAIKTPDYLNDTSKSLFIKQPIKNGTGMTTLKDLVDGIETNADLPVLSVGGKTNDTITAYLNLITNGGFSMSGANSFSVNVNSSRYEVRSDGSLALLEGVGSIIYDAGIFYSDVFDNLTAAEEKTLSVLTVTFNYRDERSYSLDIVVYNPRILKMQSNISAIEGEVYRIDSFIDSPSSTSISAGSRFSLYIEYAYNDVAGNLGDFNLPKRISSVSLDGSASGSKGSFLKGTSFILIDLNSKSALGFTYYLYTLPEDVLNISFELFENGAKHFTPKSFDTIVQNALGEKNHICEDKNLSVIERYLMVIIPVKGADSTVQYNLKAQVEKNERNIIINSEEKIRPVRVWGQISGEVSLDNTSSASGSVTIFSNNADTAMTARVIVNERFPNDYVSSMIDKDFYGTHVFRVKDQNGKYVTIPLGTIVTISKNGVAVTTKRITSSTNSVNFTINEIMRAATSDSYNDEFTISFNFAETSAKQFYEIFTDTNYYLQDDFYLSGDSVHYMNGSKQTGQAVFKLEMAEKVKVALVPENNKYLAINLADSDKTDDGEIYFGINADFSGVFGETVSSASIRFEIQKKQYDESGNFNYTTLDTSQNQYFKITLANGQDIDEPLNLDVENGMGALRFLLTVNRSALIALRDQSTGQNKQFEQLLTNYKVVAYVQGKTESGEDIRGSEKSAYFIFLICNIALDE